VDFVIARKTNPNDVTEFQKAFVIVVDDYQMIDRQTIHDALTFLFEFQPPNVHMILTMRVDPPLLLARLGVIRLFKLENAL
jgi:LuxR family transcriptional regulator, maltose regulon positive regulatory protein